MIKTKKEKRERLAKIIDTLREIYPDAPCALEYGGDPWRLLVMARLSAQCTDKRVNDVSRVLFAKYPTASDLANAEISEVENIIRPCGLYRMKAVNIIDASRIVVMQHGGILPSDMESLLELPGVGRKIANLLIGDVFGGGAIVCDTHFMRICARLGMYPEGLRDAERIEFIMRDLMDISEGSDFCHRIVIFGREICTARSPRCEACPIFELCEARGSSLGARQKFTEEKNGRKKAL